MPHQDLDVVQGQDALLGPVFERAMGANDHLQHTCPHQSISGFSTKYASFKRGSACSQDHAVNGGQNGSLQQRAHLNEPNINVHS